MQIRLPGALVAGFALVFSLVSGCTAAGRTDAPVVLVAGATGGTGSAVVSSLKAQEYEVRVLVRDEAKARTVLGDGVSYFIGDVREIDSLGAAMNGVDYVISSIGSSRSDPANNPEAVDYKGVSNLAEASAGAGVKQFVLVSSSGVTQEDHFLNKAFDNVLKWKFKGEEALRASGVPYTIVRPGGLINTPGGTEALVFAQGDTTSGRISRADVALICVASLGLPEARNKTFETYSSEEPGANDWPAMFGSLQAD